MAYERSGPVDATLNAYKEFFELTLDLCCIAGFDGYFKSINPSWSRSLGYTDQELLSQPYLSFIHPDDRESTEEAIRLTAPYGSTTLHNRYRCKDGSYKWFLWNAVAVSPVFYATVRDITGQKRQQRIHAAQHALAQVLLEFPTVVEAGPRILQALGENVGGALAALWMLDPQAELLRCRNIWLAPGIQVPEFQRVTGVMTFPPGVGLPGRVWASRHSAWIPDIVKDRNFPRMPFAASTGLHGAFAFPILCGDAVAAVIELFAKEIIEPDQELLSFMETMGRQIGQFLIKERIDQERDRKIADLQVSLASVRTLKGIISICSGCKKMRDDKGVWHQTEEFLLAHCDADITHGICTDCARKMHPDWDEVK
jgi:PAS domain S-box-containing protein